MYWDTEICAHEKYERGDYEAIMSSTKPAGGGGTSAECIPKYIEQHKLNPECVIVLTDGYLGSDWGTWTVPVLWCIIDNATRTAPNGTTVHVEF
jgi:predicted metal-dependent peptidase